MTSLSPLRQATCFFERDPDLALLRRVVAEGVGTLLLMFATVGSGLAGQRLFHDSQALGVVVSAVATAGALVSLIAAFGAVSGGHFNPLITVLQWLAGERRLDCTLAYLGAQLTGSVAGAGLAGLMFGAGASDGVPPVINARLFLSEGLASAGLMIIVFGCARSGRAETGPFAVGAWLAAAIVATPSASYANPAVTLASLVAAGPVGLSAMTAFGYVAAEIVGALLALSVIAAVYPRKVDNTAARSRPFAKEGAQ